MDKLYYDDNDRILWIQKEDGTEYPIYTLANLNGKNIRLTDDGLLEVFNGFTNEWETITDEYGYPVSLMGPPGIPGRDGKDGQDGEDSVSYRLDLSNDMDQVFVVSSENPTVQYEQVISTGCSIYANDDLESTDGWDISVITPATWPSGATYTVTESNEILFSFPIGTIVPLVQYSCTIVASSEKSTIRKDFKIKRVSGSVDYDLYIPYSYFKLYPNGSVSPTELPIKIKQKTLGSLSAELSIITPQELPKGYSIKYQWAGEQLQILSTTDKIVPKTNIIDTDQLTVSLYCDEEEIDQATLEVISSGQNGKPTQAIELTNDLDQLFIKATGAAVAGQTFTIGVSLFEGTTQQDINAQNVFVGNPDSRLFAVTIQDSQENAKNVNISITPIGESFNGASTYKFPITVGSVQKIFTLIQLQGSIDYDLVLDPAFIKAIKSDDGTFKEYQPGSLLVQVSQKEVGTGESACTYVDTLPTGYSLAWKIDQDYQTTPLVLNTPYSLPVPTNAESIPNKITVELRYTYFDESLGKNNVLVIDRAETAIYADGQKGAPGESSFYLDFTNDYDQIYKVDGVLLQDQYYSSDVYVFKGSNKVQLNDKMSLVLAEDSTFGNVTVTPDYENHCFNVRIDFVESEGSSLPQDAKQLSFKFKLSYLSEEGTSVDIFHTAKIAVLNSSHNYDLYANRYQIAKDGSGNLKDTTALKFEIRHTDLSQDGNSFNTLTTLSQLQAAGLQLKYVIDNGEDYTTVVTSDMSIGTDILRSVQNNLWIELWEGDTLRDQEQIRVVKDGADATVYYIDLSNDMDQVYLTHDRAVIETITVESGIKVYKGTEDVTAQASISITREHDAIYEERLQLIDGSLEIEYKKDTVIPTGIQVLNYCVTASLDGLEVTKRFKVYVFVGDVSYDLRPSTSVIRKDNSGNYTPSNIRIYVDKTELANITSAYKGINWSEENITVYYTVNENPLTSQSLVPTDSDAGETFATITLTPDMFGSLTNPSLQVYLNGQDNRTIDYVQIEILHDGKDGQDGQDGKDGKDGKDGVDATGYTMDFSNDSDQIYIDSDSLVYPDQVITTTITGLKGTGPLTAGTDFQITGIAVDGSPSFVDTNAIYEIDPINNCYNVSFTAIADAQVPAGTQTVSYTISAVFEGIFPLTKRYKITIIKGSTDYDLNVSTTRLRLDKDKVVFPANVTATVRKREILSNQNNLVVLSPNDTQWASENLAIKYAYSANSNVQDQIQMAIDHTSWQPYINGITTSSYQQVENCLIVALFSTASNKCLDYTIIDILSDGEQGPPGIKGDDSIVLQSQSGNSHVFYLSPDGHILQEDQRKVFEFEQIEGEQVRTFTGTLGCSSPDNGGIETSVTDTTITFSVSRNSTENTLKSYIPGTYTFTVSDGVRSVAITITLAIGATVYDLVATPMYVHYNPSSNTYDEIVFSVYTECSGGGYFEEQEITTGFELKYSNESNSNSQALGTSKEYQIDSNTSITRYYYTPTAEEAVTVNCYTSDGALQDFVILPVVRDGAPGTLEASVLEVKEGTTTVAGLNGTADSEALLWGGGTWQEAAEASASSTFSKGSGKGAITTLIKKDGTGKIGVFQINDSQALVQTSDGKVIIDSNNGIQIIDKSDNIRAVISSKSINDVDNITYPATINKGYYGTFATYNGQYIRQEVSYGTSFLWGECQTLRYQMSGSVYLSEDLQSGTEYKLNIKTLLRVNGSLCEYKTHSSTVVPEDIGSDRKVEFSNKTVINVNGAPVSDIGATSYVSGYCIEVDVTYVKNGSTTRVPIDSGNGGLALYADCELAMKSGTFIGSDGLISKKGNKYFKVDNSDTDQRIWVSGLQNTKPESSDLLYVSNKDNTGLVKSLIDSFNSLYNVLQYVDWWSGSGGISQSNGTKYLKGCIQGGASIDSDGNEVTLTGIVPALQGIQILGVS